jgi:hypothetical protein
MPATEETLQNGVGGPMLPIEKEVARGLRFTHIMLQAIDREEDEALRLIEELNQLLTARGVTNESELTDTLANPTKIPHDLLP